MLGRSSTTVLRSQALPAVVAGATVRRHGDRSGSEPAARDTGRVRDLVRQLRRLRAGTFRVSLWLRRRRTAGALAAREARRFALPPVGGPRGGSWPGPRLRRQPGVRAAVRRYVIARRRGGPAPDLGRGTTSSARSLPHRRARPGRRGAVALHAAPA